MAAELGQFALSLALATSLTGALVLAWRRSGRDVATAALARAIPLSVLMPLLAAVAALVWSFVAVDLSLAAVAGHSSSATPLAYRVLAALAAPPSCLVSVGAVLTVAAVARAEAAPRAQASTGRFPAALLALAAVQLGAAFLADEPFRRAIPAPIDGRDLDPTLQFLPAAFGKALAIIAAASAGVTLAAVAASTGVSRTPNAATISARLTWAIATAVVALDLADLEWSLTGDLASIVPVWVLATIQLHLLGPAKLPGRARALLIALSLLAWAAALLHATPSSAAWGAIGAGTALSFAAFLAARSAGRSDRRASRLGTSWSVPWQRWRACAIVGVACGAIAGAVNPTAAPGWIVAIGLGSCAWALAIALSSWGARLHLHRAGLAGLGGRMAILWPRTHLRSMAHVVAALTAASLFVSISAGEKSMVALAAGEEWRGGAQRLLFASVETGGGGNFAEDRLEFRYGSARGAAIRRHHPAREQTARRAAFIDSGLGLIAITAHGPIGTQDNAAAWSLSIVRRPLGLIALAGAGFLALAGLALVAADLRTWRRDVASVPP
ncbi:MAG: hypothetical protein JNK11_21040 [Alphaproteobacteria bacterium]|nr:hypothetical protein [Alphaproteobacteria bacterium]